MAPFGKNEFSRGCQGFTGLSPSTFLDKQTKEQGANIKNYPVQNIEKINFDLSFARFHGFFGERRGPEKQQDRFWGKDFFQESITKTKKTESR